jgi:DNA-binding transcriptional MerR regulator
MASPTQITFDFDLPAAPVAEKVLPEKKAVIAEPVVMEEKKPAAGTGKSTRGRLSAKQMASDALRVEIPEDAILFQKQYYSISEVAKMFQVNPSLLRFWENEFTILKPKKNKKGDRFFRPQDVKNLQLIYHLLRQRKYTIDGAREYLRKNGQQADEKFEVVQSLQRLKAFLLELKANL